MEQVTLNFDAGISEAYKSLREFVAHRTHNQGRPQKSIAADLDYSPSHWSRKCSESPDDSLRMTCNDLETFMQATGDTSPVLYLVEKYLAGNDGRLEQLEAEVSRLRRLKGVA